MREIYIDGVAQSKFGKDERPLEIMLADVGQNALNASKKKEPDMVIIGNFDYQGYVGQASLDALVGNELKIKSTIPIFHVNKGSSGGAGAIELGFLLAQNGNKVLVISGEQMLSKNVSREKITMETSKVIYGDERKLGVKMPIIAAIATTEYMFRYGIP